MASSSVRGGRAGRGTRIVLPALLLLGWLVVAALGGPFAGRLSEVQSNDTTSFLPSDAESTVVNRLQRGFVSSETVPAIVVFERRTGITAADRAAAGQSARQAGELSGVAGEVSPPLPSEDGQALEIVVPFRADLGEQLGTQVDRLRALTSKASESDGLTVAVGGPAGVLADFVTAFGAIDGILLVVAGGVVFVILLLVYRSPLLPVVVLAGALFALAAASALVYLLASHDVVTLNGQSQGILFILVVGAATDYGLLLVSRYREELREHEGRVVAMRVALRQTFEPILASGGTVILGLLCLLVSDLNSNRSLGPVAAIGIACALVMAFTFLPAVLVLLGRGAFWPFRPGYGSDHRVEHGRWAALARLVGAHPRRVWVASGVVLLACAAFLPTLRASGVPQTDVFLTKVDSVTAQDVLGRHFPGGSGSPALVVVRADEASTATALLDRSDGVAGVSALGQDPSGQGRPKVVDGRVLLEVTLSDAADSEAAVDTVRTMRARLDSVDSGALVGGPTATQLDTQDTAARDLRTIVPIVLVVILLVLVALLRAVVAPVLLVATVVLSFAATLGVSALVFNHVLGFPGADPAVPLFGFVFLVALGVDYNIFLMTRVREESARIGTRAGIRHGLTVTGGVITSAGVVLAATFAALGVIPILFLAQIAFIVAFGVLLDTLVVRSLLVPALGYDIGLRIWWPSRLGRGDAPSSGGGFTAAGEARSVSR